MKRTSNLCLASALLALTAAVLQANTWDGTHGDLTILTEGTPTAPGLPGVISWDAGTYLFVGTADPSVMLFKVDITYEDESGATLAATQTVSAVNNGFMSIAYFIGVDPDSITSVSVTEEPTGNMLRFQDAAHASNSRARHGGAGRK